jgi:hypothetical protein
MLCGYRFCGHVLDVVLAAALHPNVVRQHLAECPTHRKHGPVRIVDMTSKSCWVQILAQNALLSAPVMSSEPETSADGKQSTSKLIGWVDVNGIVLELIKCAPLIAP